MFCFVLFCLSLVLVFLAVSAFFVMNFLQGSLVEVVACICSNAGLGLDDVDVFENVFVKSLFLYITHCGAGES